MEQLNATENLGKIIEKIDKLRKRLEQTVPSSICEDVYRTLNRVDVLKRNLDNLVEQQLVINNEYQFLKRKLWFMKKTISLVVVPAVASVIFISIYLVFITLIFMKSLSNFENTVSEEPLNSFIGTISLMLEENPWNYLYVLLTGGASIFVLIIISSYAYRKNYRKKELNELKEKIKIMNEKLSNISSRINVLRNRYEKDSLQLTKLRETHTCICYSELNKLFTIIKSIEENLRSINNMLSREDKRNKLISIRDSIVELKNKGTFCASPLTDEFRVEIYVDDELIGALEEVIKNETVDWGKYFNSAIKFRFSTSPLMYSIPILEIIRNAIS